MVGFYVTRGRFNDENKPNIFDNFRYLEEKSLQLHTATKPPGIY